MMLTTAIKRWEGIYLFELKCQKLCQDSRSGQKFPKNSAKKKYENVTK